MRFNINEKVRVKLTDRGRRIHRENGERFREENPGITWPYTPPQEDADGWSEWQLWGLMAMFGSHLYCGATPPFETDIEIVEPSDIPAIVRADA